MAWIESHQELREHPKTKRLCRLLGLPRPTVVGYLHFLWWWAYDYAPEGDLSAFTDDDIADAVDWDGEPGALVSALIESGFINADRHIHDWGDFAQKWIERRRADRERKRAATRKATAPIRESSEGVPPEIHSRSGVTGPDLTGPDLTGPDPSPKSPPHGGRDLAPAGAGEQANGTGGGKRARRNGAAVVVEPPTPDDEALWELANEQIARDGGTPAWRANVENWIRPLVVLGRGPTGGLQLRAPPGGKDQAQRFRQVIARALADVGEPHPTLVAIVE